MGHEDQGARPPGFETEALPHLDALFRTALRLTRNRNDAEDLVQETYLRALRFWSRYEAGTNCKAWLYKIMTNLRINQAVKTRKRPLEVDFEDVEAVLAHPETEALGVTTGGDLEIFADLLDDEVKSALEAVPEDFRLVLILSVMEGFAYKEIAAILEIPIGTVMSRLYRARQLLQRTLRAYARQRGLTKDG
jgi:RNA polymerase sigma-70 factor (ECF subfamily)